MFQLSYSSHLFDGVTIQCPHIYKIGVYTDISAHDRNRLIECTYKHYADFLKEYTEKKANERRYALRYSHFDYTFTLNLLNMKFKDVFKRSVEPKDQLIGWLQHIEPILNKIKPSHYSHNYQSYIDKLAACKEAVEYLTTKFEHHLDRNLEAITA